MKIIIFILNIVKGHCCILVVRLFKMWDIFSVSSGNTWYSTRHRPSKAAPGKDYCKFELSWMMCNIQRCVETRAWKDDGWLEPGAVWMAVLSATGFVAKISWTFSEQHDKSKQQNRVALLTVRSKALCNLESFMTLNLLDAEFRHCSFLVSYLFVIHFHFVYFSSVRWKILLGFLCRNRLLLTGTPIQNSMAEVCPMTLFYPPAWVCCLFSRYRFSWDSLIVALSVTIHRPPLLELCFCAMCSYASQWKICFFVASTAVGLAAFYYANPFWFTRRIQWVVFKGYWKSCRKQISNRSR